MDAGAAFARERKMRGRIPIAAQPDHVTCGATCLHALYDLYGHPAALSDLVREVPQLPDGGGTLGVHLAIHALHRGFEVDIYTFNLQMFDPTWFTGKVRLEERLKLQREHKREPRLVEATDAYLDFLDMGGRLHFEDLTPDLISRLTARGPVLAGLSATYLYQSIREEPRTGVDDDVRGTPVGHFVLIEGYEPGGDGVLIADPWQDNPLAVGRHYTVDYHRLAGAILLSIVTYDANLITIVREPPEPHRGPRSDEGSGLREFL